MASLADFAIGNAAPGGLSSIEGVDPEMTRRFLAMAAAMPPELRQQLQIISGFRSPERQAQVNPGVKNSRHSHGVALDLGNNPAVLAWINQHPEHGLGFPLRYMPNEQNHLEMVDAATGARYIPTGNPGFKSGLKFGVPDNSADTSLDYGGGGDLPAVPAQAAATPDDSARTAALLALSQSGGMLGGRGLGGMLSQGLQPPAAMPASIIPTQQQLAGGPVPLSRRLV